MRLDRRWFLLPVFILSALFLYLAFPLLIEGIHSLLAAMVLGGTVLWALPQVLWWAMAGVLLALWGLGTMIRLWSGRTSRKNMTKMESFPAGRMEAIQKTLVRAGSGRYFREEARNLLRSLAVDLTALKLDLSEEEASQRFIRGDWTDDPELKVFFSIDPDRGKEKQCLWPWSNKSRPPVFLGEVQNILDRLKAYGNFPGGKGKYDQPNIHP